MQQVFSLQTTIFRSSSNGAISTTSTAAGGVLRSRPHCWGWEGPVSRGAGAGEMGYPWVSPFERWRNHWLVGWLAGWLVGWLVGWVVRWRSRYLKVKSIILIKRQINTDLMLLCQKGIAKESIVHDIATSGNQALSHDNVIIHSCFLATIIMNYETLIIVGEWPYRIYSRYRWSSQ